VQVANPKEHARIKALVFCYVAFPIREKGKEESRKREIIK
jgi:hypothetical protein